jgi:hypothetical protein
MGAHPRTISCTEQAFCLAIMWLEHEFSDQVWAIEADEESGRLLLVGDTDLCSQFNARAVELTHSVVDPAEAWRYYG